MFSAGTAIAAAAPVTMTPAADGGIDLRDGKGVVAHVPLKSAALRRGQPKLRELVVDDHRIAELRVPIRGTPAEEVWIGDVGDARNRGKVLWSGVTGPRDADGETAVAVEVDADRILEYQTSGGVTRCDGVPVRLFPRVYDFDSGRFRPIMSPLPEPGIEKLVARRGDPAMPAGKPVSGFHWISASSTRASGGDARALGSPVELNDGDVATAWAEGMGGDGRGEFVTARSNVGGYAVRGLRVFPGDGASLDAFRAKNRVRRFQIAFGAQREQRFDVEIPADPAADAAHWRDPFWVPLPKPMPASCVTVIVTEVALGKDASPPEELRRGGDRRPGGVHRARQPTGGGAAGLGSGRRARLRGAAAPADRAGRRGGAAHGAGGDGREGFRARMSDRGPDHARAGAEEPGGAGGAGGLHVGRDRQGRAAGHRGAVARGGGAAVAAGGAAGVGQGVG